MKGILRAVGYFALYFALTIILQALLTALVMAIGVSDGINEEHQLVAFANNNILGINILSGLFTILIFFAIFKFRKKDIKAEWRAGKFELKDIALPAVMSFSYSFVFSLITYNVQLENSALTVNSVRYYSSHFPTLGILLMAVNILLVAPVSEELAFRGIIYTRVEKTGNKSAAIFVSALLFGLVHFFAGGWILAIGGIIMGAVLGYIFCTYDSLWICILSHTAANLPDFILFNHYTMSDALRWGIMILFAIIFFISGFLLYRKSNSESSKILP